MKRDKKPSNYWTKERVFEEAKKYNTRKEFLKGCSRAYEVARKNGWLDEMHWFTRPTVHNKKWTKERVFEEARKYKSKIEFKKGCGSAYKVACENDLIDKMDWFKEIFKPSNYWTYERCYEEAKKYNSTAELRKYNKVVYNKVWKNGWLNKMPWLVDGRVKMLTDKNDSVYKYYWEETNTIYIGRTLMHRQKIRDNDHIFDYKDTVHKYAKENGLAVPPMEIIEENLTVKEGLEREDYWVNYYKERGYNVLNIAKTGIGSGSLGAISYGKWTKEKVFEEARKYTTRTEFARGNSGAYAAAHRNGWIDKMDWLINAQIIWTKENVIEESKKYKCRWHFEKNSRSAYAAAKRYGLLDELFPKYKIAS